MEQATPPGRSFQPEAFGKYYLIDKVAVGGMAEVFKAKTFSHGGFEKLLVIKRILQHLSDNNEFVEMFIDEAKISVLLQQPNIVQVYDFGKIRENYFIAMECVEGKDLKILLRKLAERRKLLPVEFAVYVAHEVCKGLDYAHKKTSLKGEPLGIVHRDMSPSNVIVAYSGEVKIADFGIAKAEIGAYNTKDGVLKGKFEYMSPEQASGLPIDHRSDLFSVGIMLHEMLTGRRLFKSESEVRTLERIKSADVKPPSTTNPVIPSRLDEIVMRALSRDAKDRYQDAKEMQTDLLEFMYPSTPDVTRESLGTFMAQLFLSEIAEERDRMEEGTKIASKLSSEVPEIDLDESWQEGGTGGTLKTPQSRIPVVIAALAVLLAAGVALYFLRKDPEVVEKVVEVQAPKPTTGILELRISPDVPAKVLLGEVEIGRGPLVVWDKVTPDQDLILKVEADGYEPFSDTVHLSAGERLRLPVVLHAIAKVTPGGTTTTPRPPEVATGPPQVIINSSPSGATVLIDGKSVGVTPYVLNSGTAGAKLGVELRLDGYDNQRFNATFPEAGKESYTRQLRAAAVPEAPGKISVNVSEGWAEVWIDGQKVETTPLYNYELAAGTHTIKVVNPSSGFEDTKTVKIQAGKADKVFFQVAP